MPNWTVKYGCSTWKDQDEFPRAEEAMARYTDYCQNPPIRGGEQVKWIALFDPKNRNVAGFATGGKYGKVQ